ncbi:uncharacterized protein KGF55_001847 [Candida pseudojiufengensis]|uniref:uncharacterized protein n=1 Tax=Candida pseudojiufengensis TaxID=497109 RepID=UPI002225780E|nr:uncharacterized protein KGF55_001847 [Candida pseudojiufengensis]KAI5964777.1 hypothetical protein KGF55_001847 [Candida pseudojiufengensis]
MLGRLFKSNNTGQINNNNNGINSSGHNHPASVVPSVNSQPLVATFEDSYSREILYGTHNANSLKPFHFNNKYFRIIVSQDGGNLRSKQVLFDTSHDQQQQSPVSSTNSSLSHSPIQTSKYPFSYQQQPSQSQQTRRSLPKNFTNSRIYHSVSDLNDLLFGCGLPTNEIQTVTKLHTLPSLTNSSSPYNSILITRLFSITDLEENESSPLYQKDDSNDWNPTSAINMKESRLKLNDLRINSRFAIGIVIPLEANCFINETVLNNWNEISHFLTILQKIVYKKLIAQLYSGFDDGFGYEYIVKKRLQFPSHILQNDFELHTYLTKLVKLIHYDNNTPRLINTNFLMKQNKEEYYPTLLNWVLEIVNWLEFKDGKNINNMPNHNESIPSFLATLFSILIQYKTSLGQKPYYNCINNTREITRVVVSTGNPAVAKRLVFILNGLINHDTSDCHQEISALTAPTTVAREIRVKPPTISIPINTKNHNKHPPIPIKAPTTSQASSSLSKSASTACLSTSMNSSYSSLQSNYSLSKFGSSGSFMDKWKSSFNNNQINNPMMSYFDDPPSLNSKKSFQSLRTPSPSIEYDEYNWNHIQNSSTTSPMSMTPSKLSRTHSLHDLFNNNNTNHNNGNSLNSMSEENASHMQNSLSRSSSESDSVLSDTSTTLASNLNNPNSFEVKRSKTSVYTPYISDKLVKNVGEYNKSTIRDKCKQIMDINPKYQVISNNTIELKNISLTNSDLLTDNSSASTSNPIIFKQNVLPPSVGYCEEYRPEFIIQSCSNNSKLETQIMNSMKNDLIYYQNNYKYDKIITRTIFINLRNREIKSIEMNINNLKYFENENDQNNENNNENNDESFSTTSVKNNTYKTKIQKIYSPIKFFGDRSNILKIEEQLYEINKFLKEQHDLQQQQQQQSQQQHQQQHHQQSNQQRQQEQQKSSTDSKVFSRKQFYNHLLDLVDDFIN